MWLVCQLPRSLYALCEFVYMLVTTAYFARSITISKHIWTLNLYIHADNSFHVQGIDVIELTLRTPAALEVATIPVNIL